MIIIEKTFTNLDNVKQDIQLDIEELNIKVSLMEDFFSDAFRNTSDILLREFQETNNTTFEIRSELINMTHSLQVDIMGIEDKLNNSN